MAEITERDLLEQIKKKEFSSLYFIYGDDVYLKEKYVEKLSASAVTELPEMNFPKLSGKDTTVRNISDEVYQIPLMSEKRCVLVDDFDVVSKEETEVKELIELFGELPESTVLIFVYNSVTPDLKKKDWSSVVKSASKNGCVINCKFKSDSEIIKYIRSWAEKRKTAIDSNVARYLIETSGKDMKKLESEVEKLCSYCKDYVTRADVDRISTKTTEATQYMLPKAILNEDISKSLCILSDLIDMNFEPVVIVNAIADSFIDIYRVKTAIDSGLNPRDIADVFNYSNRLFVIDNAVRFSKRLSVSTLERCFDILDEADSGVKGTSANQRLLLEKTVVLLIQTLKGFNIKVK